MGTYLTLRTTSNPAGARPFRSLGLAGIPACKGNPGVQPRQTHVGASPTDLLRSVFLQQKRRKDYTPQWTPPSEEEEEEEEEEPEEQGYDLTGEAFPKVCCAQRSSTALEGVPCWMNDGLMPPRHDGFTWTAPASTERGIPAILATIIHHRRHRAADWTVLLRSCASRTSWGRTVFCSSA